MTKSGARNRVRRGKPSLAASRVTNPTWQNALKRSCGLSSAVILVDSGPLVPAGPVNDPHHRGAPSCSALQPRNCSCRPLCLQRSATCLRPELAARAEAAFLRLSAAGELVPVDLNPADSERMAELVEQYADFPLRETAASSSQLWIATSRRGRAGAATGMLGVRVPLAPPLVSDGLPLLGWGTFRPVQQKVQQR
jgi:uncharacterized protein